MSFTMEGSETSILQKCNNKKPEKTFETPLLSPSKKTNKDIKFDEI